MTENEYCIRDFIAEDCDAILELFSLSFGRTLPRVVWEWRYLKGPDTPVVKLMLDGDTLFGHYAVTRMPFMVSGKESRSALSMTTMTHPDYRGKGVFTKLARATYETCQEEGVLAIYGFPNKNSEKGFFERLDWIRSPSLNEWILTTLEAPSQPEGVEACEPVFDESYDVFWRKLESRFLAVVPRTRSYLEWRITDCPPEYLSGHYRLFEARDNGALRGYLILKLYHGETEARAHVMELLTEDGEVSSALVQAARGYARENNARVLSVWLYDGHVDMPVFEKAGFQETSNVVWGGRLLGDRTLAGPEIIENWHMTMMDSDVF